MCIAQKTNPKFSNNNNHELNSWNIKNNPNYWRVIIIGSRWYGRKDVRWHKDHVARCSLNPDQVTDVLA